MKNLLFIFSIIFLISCSKSDDKNDTSEGDPIVGKWKYIYYKINLLDGSVSEGGTGGCSADEFYEFRKDGSFTFYESRYDEAKKDCKVTDNASNRWKKISNGLYGLEIVGSYWFYPTKATYNEKIIFNENKTELYITYDGYIDGKLTSKNNVLTYLKQ